MRLSEPSRGSSASWKLTRRFHGTLLNLLYPLRLSSKRSDSIRSFHSRHHTHVFVATRHFVAWTTFAHTFVRHWGMGALRSMGVGARTRGPGAGNWARWHVAYGARLKRFLRGLSKRYAPRLRWRSASPSPSPIINSGHAQRARVRAHALWTHVFTM